MGGPRNKKKDVTLEKYKEACPPHKLKDLDALVKSLNGNEAEISKTITEWWDEPETVEPDWKDVNNKAAKKKVPPPARGGGRAPGRGRGRGRDGGGGRGAGPERRGPRSTRPAKSPQPQEESAKVEPAATGPAPVTSAPTPKGAWGQRGAVAPATMEPTHAPSPSPAGPVTPVKPIVEKHADLIAPEDPTPSGMPSSVEKQVRAPSTPTGNVWATKGSAHLIRAEKPKPPQPPPQMRMPQIVEPPRSPAKPSLAPPPEPPVAPPVAALETGLSPSLSNHGSWNTAPSLEMTQSASSVTESALGLLPEVSAPPVPPAMSPRQPPPRAPTNVLNMGHWESGEGDDSQNLGFGFGSFGPESDAAEELASNAPMPSKESSATLSPARPPPGLSIGGGMPPMPKNAVLVHELENKLESASLGKEEESGGPKPMTSNLPSQPQLPPGHPGATPNVPPNYNAVYGMGMYNYNNAGNGFMGVPPAGLGLPPHQKSQQTGHQTPPVSGGVPQHLPPGGLYGSTAPSVGIAGDSSNGPTSSNDNSVSGVIPPGMPSGMPYNPALFYGQQPYQMGQPHGGGYGYGYGAQFGGGGFYQQQGMMGQSGGYPSYDDQPQQGRGDYAPKSNNRYRNNGSQYQNQFNPQQHGGYGAQPYNMGYNMDQFNQRGGYGPPDPYGAMQPQQQQGGSNYNSGGMSSFQDDSDHHKGKKGGRGGFQQHHQQVGGQQQHQPFLGGSGGGDTHTPSTTNQGWSNNNNNSQSGGWGGPSWQGGN